MNRFARIQRRVSYGLVCAGLLLLVLSGELAPPVWGAALAGIALAWRRWERAPLGPLATTVWNLALIAIFLALAGLSFATGNWLLHMTLFGIVMVVSKLFLIHQSRDILQLYVLSFLMVLGGAVMNPGLSFGLLLVGYVVLLTWGLVLLHFRKDMEARTESEPSPAACGAERFWQTRRLVTASFLFGTSVLALMVFAASLVIFFFFPRVGLGFFFANTRRSQAVTGFGDDLELGHFGKIRDNQAVIMRIELPDEPPQPGRRLRIRGISFDTYDGRGWKKSDHLGRIMRAGPEGSYDVVQDRGVPQIDPKSLLRQEIYLEPIETGRRVLFGLPRIRYVRRPGAKLKELQEAGIVGSPGARMRFVVDEAGDVSRTGGAEGVAFRYTVFSDTRPFGGASPGDPGEELGGDGRLPRLIKRRYLQLPPDLSPRVRALAQRLVGDARTPFEKARAIERGLQGGWRYSTEGGHDPVDPLGDFLFSRKRGHCEYFATAMVVLARSIGMAARPVNGFYGGVWNHFGNYYAVRQADAHSWVEVYLSGAGWVTFDPTPAAERYVRGGSGLWADVEAWVDSLRLRWYKWVIEFDLNKQLGLVSGVLRFLAPNASPAGRGGGSQPFKALSRVAAQVFTLRNLAIVVGVIVGLVLLRVLRKRRAGTGREKDRRPRRRRDVSGALRLFGQLERQMARRGYPRADSRSPREWAGEIAADQYPGASALLKAIHAVEEVVWGGRPFDDARRQALERAVEACRL